MTMSFYIDNWYYNVSGIMMIHSFEDVKRGRMKDTEGLSVAWGKLLGKREIPCMRFPECYISQKMP